VEVTREGLPPPLRLGTGLVVWRGADLNHAHLPRRRASASAR
jgi:hypothetical protein